MIRASYQQQQPSSSSSSSSTSPNWYVLTQTMGWWLWLSSRESLVISNRPLIMPFYIANNNNALNPWDFVPHHASIQGLPYLVQFEKRIPALKYVCLPTQRKAMVMMQMLHGRERLTGWPLSKNSGWLFPQMIQSPRSPHQYGWRY